MPTNNIFYLPTKIWPSCQTWLRSAVPPPTHAPHHCVCPSYCLLPPCLCLALCLSKPNKTMPLTIAPAQPCLDPPYLHSSLFIILPPAQHQENNQPCLHPIPSHPPQLWVLPNKRICTDSDTTWNKLYSIFAYCLFLLVDTVPKISQASKMRSLKTG